MAQRGGQLTRPTSRPTSKMAAACRSAPPALLVSHPPRETSYPPTTLDERPAAFQASFIFLVLAAFPSNGSCSVFNTAHSPRAANPEVSLCLCAIFLSNVNQEAPPLQGVVGLSVRAALAQLPEEERAPSDKWPYC